MTSAFNSLLSISLDPARRLWFIIDKFAPLLKQEAFSNALSKIRKNGES
jgi:hypothetical protein